MLVTGNCTSKLINPQGQIKYLLPIYPGTQAQQYMVTKFVDQAFCTKWGICHKGCSYNAIELNSITTFDMDKCYEYMY